MGYGAVGGMGFYSEKFKSSGSLGDGKRGQSAQRYCSTNTLSKPNPYIAADISISHGTSDFGLLTSDF